MVMHARSGGTLEVMGLILGKVDGNTMFVMDSFALPVEGTETRVNAQAQAYEYMSSYIEAAKLVKHYKIHIPCINRWILGGKARKRDWLVPQSSRLRLLVVWYRREHTNVEPKLPRTVCRYRHWSSPHHFSWKSVFGCFPNVSKSNYIINLKNMSKMLFLGL